MGDGFYTELRKVEQPSSRLAQISQRLADASTAVHAAASAGAGGAGTPEVADAADAFRTDMQRGLTTLADDVRLLGETVQASGVVYRLSHPAADAGA